jgi:hypothetical protein
MVLLIKCGVRPPFSPLDIPGPEGDRGQEKDGRWIYCRENMDRPDSSAMTVTSADFETRIRSADDRGNSERRGSVNDLSLPAAIVGMGDQRSGNDGSGSGGSSLCWAI